MSLLLRKHNKLDKIPADVGADKGSAHLKAPVPACAHIRARDMDVTEGL